MTTAAENSSSNLTVAQAELLKSFKLTDDQRREVWRAWQDDPDGVERCALEARAFTRHEPGTGAGLFLTMIRRGDHLDEIPDPHAPRQRITGWRWVRGSHSGTYVRDPQGTDPLPPGYGLDG